MSDCLTLLDQALELANKELEQLSSDIVDNVETMARERSRLVARAMEARNEASLDALRGKLQQLQSLQGRLTLEAKRLHESVRLELLRTKKESTRMAGYGKAYKAPPLFSKFLSKRG